MAEKSEDCPTKPSAKTDQFNNKLNIMAYFVYIIQSINSPQTIYVGYTTNIKGRLATHNSGGNISTKNDRPWKLVVCMAFKEIECAKKFEKYLKSQSGRAFAKKRFW